jgi:choline dehydrogenase-like flavoprotein
LPLVGQGCNLVFMAVGSYDLILVGSGFASSFFLHRALEHLGKDARVLVLEAGSRDPFAWQISNGRNSSIPYADTYINNTPRKPWVYSPGFGGSSKCWWACTPRMLPADFELRSRYGVGLDWPITYSDLEESYCDAEEIMSVSGPSEDTPFERSRPYPQPPHNLTDPDKILKKAFPTGFYVQPSARARVATKQRGPCCATGTCRLCPINSKFTVENELSWLYADPRVELKLNARVLEVVIEGGRATGVRFNERGKEQIAKSEVVGLGANAIFNPFLLLQSGLSHEYLGKHLCEQLSITVTADLDGVDNFQGSTSFTGHGYLHYDGDHRKERAAALIETRNIPRLRHEKGRWRQRLEITFSFENLLDRNCVVSTKPGDRTRPNINWAGDSDYAIKSLKMVRKLAEEFLKPLPVETMWVPGVPEATVSHNMCTTIMGKTPSTSIVDPGLVHHDVRNLLVLGASTFPTASPANPTLTLSALSLMAADKYYG